MSSSDHRARRPRVLRGDIGRTAVPALLASELTPAVTAGSTMLERIEAARAAGYEAGLADGFAAGRQAAIDEQSDLARSVADALVRAAASVAPARRRVAEDVASEIASLAFELAEAAIGRELSLGEGVADAVTRALALVPEGEDLVIRCHPDETAAASDVVTGIPDATARIIPDPAVEPGGCVVEAGPCRVDAQLRPALERARLVLVSAGGTDTPEAGPGEAA